MTIIVYHRRYGCDTGCCGHAIQENDDETNETFEFDHADGDFREWAEKLVKTEYGEEHVKDLDWENCIIQSYETCTN